MTIDSSHPGRYFADSPFGPYGTNVNHPMTGGGRSMRRFVVLR